PPSTFQLPARLGSLSLQPVKSLPLKKAIGLPHCRRPVRFRAGALRPIHGQEVPLEPVKVPTSWPPTTFPLNSVSSLKPSSPFGERNSISPSFIWTRVG